MINNNFINNYNLLVIININSLLAIIGQSLLVIMINRLLFISSHSSPIIILTVYFYSRYSLPLKQKYFGFYHPKEDTINNQHLTAKGQRSADGLTWTNNTTRPLARPLISIHICIIRKARASHATSTERLQFCEIWQSRSNTVVPERMFVRGKE